VSADDRNTLHQKAAAAKKARRQVTMLNATVQQRHPLQQKMKQRLEVKPNLKSLQVARLELKQAKQQAECQKTAKCQPNLEL